jgi:hypothetical protein
MVRKEVLHGLGDSARPDVVMKGHFFVVAVLRIGKAKEADSNNVEEFHFLER